MTSQWYFVRHGSSAQGPITEAELVDMLNSAKLAPGDLVWRNGMPDWVRADSAFSAHSAATAPPIVPPPRSERTSEREAPRVEPSEHSLDSQGAANRRQGQRASSRPSQIVWIGVVLTMAAVSCFWFNNRDRGQLPKGKIASRQTVEAASVRSQRTGSRGQSSAAQDPSSRSVIPESSPTFAVQRKDAAAEESGPVDRQTESVDSVGDLRPPAADTTAASKRADPRELAATTASAGEPGHSASQQAPTPPAERMATRTIYQEIAIQRQPTFSVQGVEIRQNIRYRIWSRLEVSPPANDGHYQVIQIVENTRLEDADELSRKTYAKSLAALRRQQYTFLFNPQNEVVRFTGYKSNTVSISVDLRLSGGSLLTTVIDEDGWKELAQLTLFQPPGGREPGLTYERPMTHNWQPLGKWFGTTRFVSMDSTSDQEQISYTHQLSYGAPDASTGGLPFRIASAAFKIDEASGTIAFDRQQHRVSRVHERFQVSGVVQAELLGQTTEIQLRERQLLTIRVTDQPPQ